MVLLPREGLGPKGQESLALGFTLGLPWGLVLR
jgi:hypothetical protein